MLKYRYRVIVLITLKELLGSFKKKYMTKKDYIAIASVVKSARDKTTEEKENTEAVRHIITGLINVFEKDNERFDATRFENAIYD